MAKVNVSGGGSRSKNLIPAGKYLFTVKHAEKTLSNKGTPRISFRCEVAAGEAKGKAHTEDCYLTDEAIWKLQDFSKACGVTGEIDTDDPAALIDAYCGKQLFIVLIHDSYKDKDGADQVGVKSTAYDSTEAKAPKDRKQRPAQAAGQTDETPATEAGGEEIPF